MSRSTDIFVVVASFTFICLLSAVALLFPAGPFVVVVAPPGMQAAQMQQLIGQAGGQYVAEGRYPWMAVAYSDRTGFVPRLFRHGALLVTNHWMTEICLTRGKV
ncbi:hypothetical protein ATY81_27940 [Rhizobium sp. R72]|uniref:hypothetical protein n=1 Tax=unclassified Rhizobium TaxID=2613769 RepID=UPI000B5314AD|nr:MULTISPECIES: hypothetical protein [unclassified Rhizobium]OWV87986.1 hypothetical protein ATY79_29315 [Rhizobium sp. R693]OWV96096.1 hypothetical protein ATY81_27940 [Rhizobium sp. R72]OWV96111.1 hypothetical protein ATY80_27940 [Rhizobium sp. R711]